MDDQINEKLKNILSDPESLKSILSIASAFGASKVENNSEKNDDAAATPGTVVDGDAEKSENTLSALVSAPERSNITQPLNLQKKQFADDRVNLLMSIKPFLSEKKRQRVDSLVKALGAAKLISSYKELDIFSKFI